MLQPSCAEDLSMCLESASLETYYLQSQNGNLYSTHYFEEGGLNSPSEFEPLRPDVLESIPWCTEAFGVYNFRRCL
jgi:jumonji domain-containing protein 7